ncbi:hypothetical protein HOO65_010496 [Ceratocystis lukuohia]|uniref:DUF7143 domain-containing protein n=1 Tax=Ceratocystis lukuohia TaxID=2019550 RepID=A0ABR4MS93_9PEZI
MHSFFYLIISSLAIQAAPSLIGRAEPCFVIGTTALPAEVSDAAASLANTVTCDTSKTTISGVPDTIDGSTTFSSIDFSKSSQTPLAFALSTFATENNLASTDLAKFQEMANVYVATEAGIRSVGGALDIKVPKFFLAFQISRIQTAQGSPPTTPQSQVDHLLQKVLKNSPRESAALKDQVTALSKKLS